jgi:hypothetical protein
LFTPNEKQPIRVLIHGLAYFSQKLPAFLASDGWEFRNYPPRWSPGLSATIFHLYRCHLAYSWGGRLTMGKFLQVARYLRKKKLVMFWCGSDVLDARMDFEAGRIDPWIAEKIHWAGSPWLAEEVRAMGLNCEYVPSTWVAAVESIEDLPKKFSVLAYLPDANRVNLYGIDQVLEVARAMPQVDFTIVGLQSGQSLNTPANVTVHGRVSHLTPFYRNATVVWRPARHDGLSFMALEALAHGRHVMWSYPFRGAIHVRDASSGRIELQRLFELHQARRLEINSAGVEFIAQNFSPQKIREGILGRWKKIVEAPLRLARSEFASRI